MEDGLHILPLKFLSLAKIFDTCNAPTPCQLALDFRNVDLINWDEDVMCSRYCIDAVNHAMQNLAQNRLPFAGKLQGSLEPFDKSSLFSKFRHARRSLTQASTRLYFNGNLRLCDFRRTHEWQHSKRFKRWRWRTFFSKLPFSSLWRTSLIWQRGLCHTTSSSCTWVRCQ